MLLLLFCGEGPGAFPHRNCILGEGRGTGSCSWDNTVMIFDTYR